MNRKPQPLHAVPYRKHCPVCGEVTYSAAGIHPQCAMQQADAKRMQRIKPPSKLLKKKMARDADVKPWQKVCPKCQVAVHIRKSVCECGHTFRTRAKREED